MQVVEDICGTASEVGPGRMGGAGHRGYGWQSDQGEWGVGKKDIGSV